MVFWKTIGEWQFRPELYPGLGVRWERAPGFVFTRSVEERARGVGGIHCWASQQWHPISNR